MRKTKIIATIGPASSDPSVFSAMCRAGVNVARLNFSHGTHEEQLAKIHMIKKVREELDLPIAIMLDTKGPEYRTGTFKNGKVHINDGDLFTFTTRDVEGSSTIVSVSYKNLAKELRAGDTILVNNGLVSFRVLSVEGTEIRCQAIIGGDLSDHKSMSFPNKVLKQPYLSEQDKKDLLLGIENGVDFIAASFVSCQQDILDLKAFLSAHGGGTIDIIAKIENRAGVDNIESICDVCEGIMVARGDLGVEVPYEELPQIQKMLIDKCRLASKRCITATEMLESMISQPRPTRAEISDVCGYGNACAFLRDGQACEWSADGAPLVSVWESGACDLGEARNKVLERVIVRGRGNFLLRVQGGRRSRIAPVRFKDGRAEIYAGLYGDIFRLILETDAADAELEEIDCLFALSRGGKL